MEFPTLQSERLLLRKMDEYDAEALYAYFSQDIVTQYFGMDTLKELEDAHKLLDNFQQTFEQKRGYRWGIILKETNTLIGTFGIHSLIATHKRAEIGYDLNPDYWHKGYATEALETVLEFGFNELELHRIGAIIFPENTASKNLVLKRGFVKEGLLRHYVFQHSKSHDTIVYSLTQKEWNAKKEHQPT
jgi:[ribosomal protein S5]-alanine N-acetyltransferase